MTFEEKFPKAYAAYADGVAKEKHFGMNTYISKDGEVLIEDAVGNRGPDDRPLNKDDLMMWMSASKPTGAIAIAQLMEQGKLDFDEPVCEVIDDFGMFGKSTITTRHMLMHTSCFANVPLPMEMEDWGETIDAICDYPGDEGAEIGETAAYHSRTSWFILAEMLHRIDGRQFQDYVREEIFLPLGMEDSWIGMDPARYRDYEDRLGHIYTTAHGRCTILNSHSERAVTTCIPGGSGRGPVRELGRLYEMLLNGGTLDGAQILKPETVADMSTRHREGKYDATFMHEIDWGLGFIVNSKNIPAKTHPYGFGEHASDRAFGHGGKESVNAYTDPEHGLVVITAFNGMPSEPTHTKRVYEFNTALYEDLGLA
jgi:CubicO group peptidase (beta-lactamase class C family)